MPERAAGMRVKDVCERHGQGTASLGLPRYYLMIEGPAADVDAMIAWCHTGPSRARVTNVEVTPLEPTGEAGFTIH